MLGLDPHNSTVKAMLSTWERREEDESRRPYLGASMIGSECDRFLWLAFRWAFARPTFDGRILRLFNRGHREEPVFEQELQAIGCEVEGTQHEETFAKGHGKAHCDGVVRGLVEAPKTWHVVDFKTMNDKSFKKFLKCSSEEDFAEAYPRYFGQLQIEMALMGLDRCALFAVNKNDDSLHMLRMRNVAGDHYVARAENTVEAEAPPCTDRTPTDYRCRFCDASKICHGLACAEISCKTCCYSTPVDDGKWTCSLSGAAELVPNEFLQMGCTEHIFIPGTLKLEYADFGDGWVSYSNGLINAGAGTELPNGLSFRARATSAELKRNWSAVKDGDFDALLEERICFPEKTQFEACDPETDIRKAQLLELIESGDENAKSDYFKEYGN